MKPQFIEDNAAQAPWTKPAERVLEGIAGATVKRPGRWLRNFLHGTFMGHPLHPATIDVPIGAFTTATVLDIMDASGGNGKYSAGAKAAVGIGLATSTLAAASGLADWSHSDQPARRVGVLHALFNSTAILCYLASLILRKNHRRAAAMETGLAGWLFLMVGAFLGGRMVYNHRMGVDHADRRDVPDFTPVIPENELPEGEPHRVEANGVGVLLVRVQGKVYAIGEKCSHLGGPLEQGKLQGATITCPWHGSEFDVTTGKVLKGPAAFSEPCYEVRVRDGQIEVRVNKKW